LEHIFCGNAFAALSEKKVLMDFLISFILNNGMMYLFVFI